MDKEQEFMIGLEALTRKIGIKICGCGCCGSPFLDDAKITSAESGYGYGAEGKVEWMDPKEEWGNWEKYKVSIVKGDGAMATPQDKAATWQSQPTSDGYWWLDSLDGEIVLVEVMHATTSNAIAFYIGDEEEGVVKTIRGQWQGPIKPPEVE